TTAPARAGLPSRRRVRLQPHILPVSDRPRAPRQEVAHLLLPRCEPYLLLCAREEDSKRAADTWLTVDMHLPAVGCNNVLNHRQAEARTFGPGNLSTGAPNEFLEYPLLLMRVNPQPFIAHANCYPSILAAGLCPHC